MGIFSFALQPLMDIIHGLEAPVAEVERIFGTVIQITEDIINQLISIVKELDDLFDEAAFEQIFVTPFKTAILTVLNGIESISGLIFMYGQEGFSDVTDVLQSSIQGIYSGIKDGLADMNAAYMYIVNNISPGPTRIIDGSLRDVNRLIDRVEADVDLLKQKVKNICQVTYAEATDIKQEFVGFAKGAASSLEGDVNRVGNIIVDDTKDLLHQATNRMKNENAVVDLFILLMIGIILLGIIYLYILTRSTSLLVVSILAMIVTLFTIFVF